MPLPSRTATLFPALAALVGCAHQDPRMGAKVIDTPVLHAEVSYTSIEPIRAWVEFGPEDGPKSYTPISEFTNKHTFDLLGLRYDATYTWRVIVQTTGGSLALEEQQFDTPAMPDSLTPMLIEGDREEGVGKLLFPLYHPTNQVSLLYIVDDDGYLIWSYVMDGMVLSARPSRDGSGVWAQVTRVTADATSDTSTVEFVSFDGTQRITLDAPYAHHDFIERDDGAIVTIASELRKIDKTWIMGDQLQVLNLDGTTETFWSAFDSIPVEENAGWSDTPADWTHANGLDWDEETDTWAVSLFRQHEVLLLDGDGLLQQRVGVGSDWTFPDDPGYGPQHGPRITPTGIQVFDNAGAGVSRLVQYDLDFTTRTATLAWEQGSPDGRQILVIGDGFRVESGACVSSWGEAGDVLTITPFGQVVRRLDAEGDGTVGRIFALDNLYADR